MFKSDIHQGNCSVIGKSPLGQKCLSRPPHRWMTLSENEFQWKCLKTLPYECIYIYVCVCVYVSMYICIYNYKCMSREIWYVMILEQVTKEYEGAEATSSHVILSKALTKGLFSLKRKREDPSPRQSNFGKGSSSSSSSAAKSSFSLFDAPAKRGKGKH